MPLRFLGLCRRLAVTQDHATAYGKDIEGNYELEVIQIRTRGGKGQESHRRKKDEKDKVARSTLNQMPLALRIKLTDYSKPSSHPWQESATVRAAVVVS